MHKRGIVILWAASLMILSACGEELKTPTFDLCGDGKVDEVKDPVNGEVSEQCDDGNTADKDGCSADCKTIEDGYDCPKTGGLCQKIVCGDGIVVGDEQCDDGNTEAGDGCSADCKTIEEGYDCPKTGGPCTKKVKCGNSTVEGDEQCDDGNTADGDGCSSTCQIEETRYQPDAGPDTACGDGKFEAGEICEIDRVTPNAMEDQTRECRNKDGVCVRASIEGADNCGNGVVEDDEECDDGNKINSGDHCTNKCKNPQEGACKLQNGSKATVLLVTDGDTLKLRVDTDGKCTKESKVTLRMHGIDCPECGKTLTESNIESGYTAEVCSEAHSTDYSDKTKNEKGGFEAWQFVNEQLESVNYQVIVGCETVSDSDPLCLADATLSRFLGYIGIEKDGQSIDLAQEIIRAGHGMAYTQFTSKRIETYCEAEKAASEAKVGIWGFGETLEQIVTENFDVNDSDAYLLDDNHCK